MEEQPQPFKKSTQGTAFKVVVVLCFIVLAGVVGWLVYRVEEMSTKQDTVAVEPDTSSPDTNNGWNTVVKSGSGGFQLTLPDGWSPVIRPLDADAIFMAGTVQPHVAKGAKVEIQDVAGYGSDSTLLFSAVLGEKHDGTQATRGQASEFKVGKGEEEIVGKKYAYIYDKDDASGIGQLRLAGDRDYVYVFPFGSDKEFRLQYSVYGSDPRNQVEIVDEIVRTLTLTQTPQADL